MRNKYFSKFLADGEVVLGKKVEKTIKHIDESFKKWWDKNNENYALRPIDFSKNSYCLKTSCLSTGEQMKNQVTICFDGGFVYDFINSSYSEYDEDTNYEFFEQVFGLKGYEYEDYSSWAITVYL